MPRPTKLTRKRLDMICATLSAGGTRKAAAALAGVGETTFHDWMRRARDDDQATPLQLELLTAVERAEATATMRAVATIDESIDKGDWKAAAWWLERRRRQDWGRPQPMPVAQPEQEKMPQTFADLVRMAHGMD